MCPKLFPFAFEEPGQHHNSSGFWQCSGDTGFARFGVSLGMCLGWGVQSRVLSGNHAFYTGKGGQLGVMGALSRGILMNFLGVNR